MDDARIGAVIEVQSMGVESVDENRLFQNKVFSRSDGLEIAFFRLGKVKISIEFSLLESRTGTSHRQIVKQ